MKNDLDVIRSLRLGALSVALALAGTGFAQAKDIDPGENCHCIVPAGSTGQVLSSSGDVQVSLAQGFSPAVPGTALSQGSLIIVGVRSDAHIVFGGCHLSILPLRDVSLDPVGGGTCVRETPIDGRTAGFDPAAITTLGAQTGTFPQAAGAAAAGEGTTTRPGGAAAATSEATDSDIPAAAIVAGVAAVGAFVAIAASNSGGGSSPGTPDPVEPVKPVSP